jgi:hypothetical protein
MGYRMTVPPLGKTGAPPLDEMYWCGNTAPDGWSIIEMNPAPYYQGMRIGRRQRLEAEALTVTLPAGMEIAAVYSGDGARVR